VPGRFASRPSSFSRFARRKSGRAHRDGRARPLDGALGRTPIRASAPYTPVMSLRPPDSSPDLATGGPTAATSTGSWTTRARFVTSCRGIEASPDSPTPTLRTRAEGKVVKKGHAPKLTASRGARVSEMLRVAPICCVLAVAACSGDAADHPDASQEASYQDPALPACTWDTSLYGVDGSTGCYAARTNIVCTGVNGCTVECLVDDPSQCPGKSQSSCSSSAGSGSSDSGQMACTSTCKPDEYAVECAFFGQGTSGPPPSACRADTTAIASPEAEYYCCPCGS
jgi:hypothetical protein